MLRGGANPARGPRGATASSRGSSTRGGRGASSSPSKFVPSYQSSSYHNSTARWPRDGTYRVQRRHGGGRYNFADRGRGSKTLPGASSPATSQNAFENERQQNAAKREQKGQIRGTANMRGSRGSRGRFPNKTVRFVDQAENAMKTITPTAPSDSSSKTPAASPFASQGTAKPTSTTPYNPFATTASPFGSPNTSAPTSSPSNSIFGSSQAAVSSNPFASTSTAGDVQATNVFSAPSSDTLKSNPFGGSSGPFPKNGQAAASNGAPHSTGTSAAKSTSLKQPGNSIFVEKQPTAQAFSASRKSKLAADIERLLLRKGIFAPSWPTERPGDPSQRSVMEAFWQANKAYRAKVRAALIQSGQLDDPDKPKKLSEAIDFKGTCEDMCPEFEKITRIVERDVQGPEKETAPDGYSLWPSPRKMIKALARSAAGQDAPLPEDVRSPAALRDTLDYLVNTILGSNDLPAIHGFLWNRTRAIRRDFVFQQSSMSSDELVDQVYCLERITRFHVIALHQMSHQNVVAEDFSEQQEMEQLGKALLSLIHAYEDCNIQGIECENEAEFRAYYVLYNAHNPGILEIVQDWGWKFWGESSVIRIAVSLVEALQNTWDLHGPLKPPSVTDIAHNSYSRFFTILKDRSVSYHMACFAEIHFNKVRKAALKTILASYRKQKLQTEDWTISNLNAYLHFDDEQDIIPFAEAYGLNFDENDGVEYLSFNSDDSMLDPFPQLKQAHSTKVVESKRGSHSLPDVIHHTIYDNTPETDGDLFRRAQNVTEPAGLGLFAGKPTSAVPSSSGSQGQSLIQPEQKEDKSLPGMNSQLSSASGSPFNVDNVATDSSSIFKQPKTTLPSSVSFPGLDKDKPAATGASPSTISPIPGLFSSKDTISGNATSSANESSKFSNIGANITPVESSYNTKSIQSTIFPTVKHAIAAQSDPAVSSDSPLQRPIPEYQAIGVPSVLASSSERFPTTSTSSTSAATTFFPNKPADHKLSNPIGEQRGNMQESTRGDLSTLTASSALPNTASSGNGLTSSKLPAVTMNSLAKPPPSAMAEWVVQGKRGLVDHFVEYEVEEILRAAVAQFRAEETERQIREEAEETRMLIERFRTRSLATKYGQLWRDNAHRSWMKRKGRAAREVRRQMAESLRTSKIAEREDLTDQFKASQGDPRRRSTDQILLRTSTQNGVLRSHGNSTCIAQEKSASPRNPGQTRTRDGLQRSGSMNAISKSSSRHRRNRSETGLRRSIIADHMALPGSSRTHLLPDSGPNMEPQRRASGVQTDYFRLKARGITTLPDGTPLATMAAYHLPRKTSFDGFLKPATPKRPIKEALFNSVPAKPVGIETQAQQPEEELDGGDIEAIKARARKLVAEDREKRQQKKKRMFDDNDEELFARAKRIREQMDEGTEWFKAEVEKESYSRSRS